MLCDRFTDSTEAYQGGGRKLGSEAVLELHRILCGDLQPDLTDPAGLRSGEERRARPESQPKCRRRANKNSAKDENRFEQENALFLDACAKATWRSRPRAAACARGCEWHARRDAAVIGVGAGEIEDWRN